LGIGVWGVGGPPNPNPQKKFKTKIYLYYINKNLKIKYILNNNINNKLSIILKSITFLKNEVC
jgi:hypothetical protein